MNAQQSLDAAIHEEVKLHDYDPAWPATYLDERERLCLILPKVFVGIEHIGSSAVPSLVAKPIVDILAGVRSMAVAQAVGAVLCESGYTTSAEFNATLADRKWFMRWAHGRRTHHLHVVVHGGPVWHARMRFRDVLRANPDLAARYVKLKTELAKTHATDREAYTAAKAEFVRTVSSAGNWLCQL